MNKALATLELLMNELCMENKFRKIQEQYIGEVSIETTLSILIRCKIIVKMREALKTCFIYIQQFESLK